MNPSTSVEGADDDPDTSRQTKRQERGGASPHPPASTNRRVKALAAYASVVVGVALLAVQPVAGGELCRRRDVSLDCS